VVSWDVFMPYSICTLVIRRWLLMKGRVFTPVIPWRRVEAAIGVQAALHVLAYLFSALL
jgi:hypothetical protein